MLVDGKTILLFQTLLLVRLHLADSLKNSFGHDCVHGHVSNATKIGQTFVSYDTDHKLVNSLKKYLVATDNINHHFKFKKVSNPRIANNMASKHLQRKVKTPLESHAYLSIQIVALSN